MNLTSKKITELDLDFVKGYLRVDFTDEDNLISSLILAAQSYVQTMMGFKIVDEWPTVSDIPEELTVACLLIISNWYDNRHLQTSGVLGAEIVFAVSAIIDAHKKPLKDYNETIATTDTTGIL